MLNKEDNVAWLQGRATGYHSRENDKGDVVEDLDEIGKLGQGFASVDKLEEINLGGGNVLRPTYITARLTHDQKAQMCELLGEFAECFAWDYTEMPGLSRELVEHMLPIKQGFRPHKQPAISFSP
jgi:hypothetical protein